VTTPCASLVSNHDKEKLIDRIVQTRNSWLTYAPYLDWFRAGLQDARTVPPTDVPVDVLTMNSRFDVMDLTSGETANYTLVYPEDEALDHGKLCVLSPMGMALFGARVGDIVRWVGANGPRSAEVLRLTYQPEAAGDHHL
jgi:regulator of nucleoside diphosphate kinase